MSDKVATVHTLGVENAFWQSNESLASGLLFFHRTVAVTPKTFELIHIHSYLAEALVN